MVAEHMQSMTIAYGWTDARDDARQEVNRESMLDSMIGVKRPVVQVDLDGAIV